MWQLIAIVFASHFASAGGAFGRQSPTLQFAALQRTRSRLPRYFAASVFLLVALFAAFNAVVAIDRSAEVTPFIAGFSGVVRVAAGRVASSIAGASTAVQEAITPRVAAPRQVASVRPVAAKPRARVPVYWSRSQRPVGTSSIPSRTVRVDVSRVQPDASAPLTLLGMALAPAPELPPDGQTQSVASDAVASLWPLLIQEQVEAALLAPPSAGQPANTEAAARYVETRMGRVEVRDLANGAQQWRYPPDGNFDAVIVGSSGVETVPQAQGALSGYPVQTVFLALGEGKEWVLQYCATDNAWSPQQNGMIVLLPRPTRVDPPWPLVAELPPATGAEGEPGALLYAVLGPTGRFTRVRTLAGRASDVYANTLLPYLDRWQFRPAQRAGVPVEVELLLLAPPSRGAGHLPQVGIVLHPSVGTYARVRRQHATS